MKTPHILLALALSSSFTSVGFAADGPMEKFPDKVPVPSDNPMTPQKIELGRKLFHDNAARIYRME